MKDGEFLDWAIALVKDYAETGRASALDELGDAVEAKCDRFAAKLVIAVARLVRDEKVDLKRVEALLKDQLDRPDYKIDTMNAPNANVGTDQSHGKNINGQGPQGKAN
jgi:hypothetical protein